MLFLVADVQAVTVDPHPPQNACTLIGGAHLERTGVGVASLSDGDGEALSEQF